MSDDDDYAAKMAAAKTRAPHSNLPPLPRFDQDPIPGRVVSESARKVLTAEEQARLQSSGGFIPGIGSAYAANQPKVPRTQEPKPETGEFVNPPRPPGSSVLRPDTAQQVREVLEANAEKPAKEDDLKKVEEEIDEIDTQYETDEFGRKVRSLTANRVRREAIEKRCDEMQVEDLILQGEIRQKVPIIPGKLEPVYRSVSGSEDLFIKRWMSSERGSEQYIMDRYSLLNLTAGIYALNGRPFPSHLDKSGEPDKEAFEAKLKLISKLPFTLLADLSVNYAWFSRRVQRLLVVDNIKGF
jgi:hypothetical protein